MSKRKKIFRAAILEEDEELQLAKEMKPLWNKHKMSAKQIAEKLQFGAKGTPYKKLKTYHVYYYRRKFNKGDDNDRYPHLEKLKGKFPPRPNIGIKEGENRYKQEPNKTMTYLYFKEKLNRMQPPINKNLSYHPWHRKYIKRKRAYLILHLWTPLRRSELLERTADDFTIENDTLKIRLYRKKKYYKPGAKPEPFFVPLKLPLMDEVIDWIFNETWRKPLRDKDGNLVKDDNGEKVFSNRPFDFTGQTGLNYVKDVFGYTKFPHYFRYNYITRAIETNDDPDKLITRLLDATGLDLSTVVNYVITNSPEHEGAIGRRLLEVCTEKGNV